MVAVSVFFGLSAFVSAVAAALLTGLRQLRRPDARSKSLEHRVSKEIAQMGYFGEPEVTVSRKDGGRWHFGSYHPSEKDRKPDPNDDGSATYNMMKRFGGTLPIYLWSDRVLSILILTFALLAAACAVVAVLLI